MASFDWMNDVKPVAYTPKVKEAKVSGPGRPRMVLNDAIMYFIDNPGSFHYRVPTAADARAFLYKVRTTAKSKGHGLQVDEVRIGGPDGELINAADISAKGSRGDYVGDLTLGLVITEELDKSRTGAPKKTPQPTPTEDGAGFLDLTEVMDGTTGLGLDDAA